MMSLTPTSLLAFTVGTSNLWHYRKDFQARAERMCEQISQGVPDVMGFQEAARWRGHENLIDIFIESTQYSGVYKKTNDFLIMKEGLSLVSRYPSRNLGSQRFSGDVFYSRQYFNFGEFSTPEGWVRVINVHLSPFARGAERRVKQVQSLLEFIKTQDSKIPTIIVGDFNDVYDSLVLKKIRSEGYVDVMNGDGATWDCTTNPYTKKNGCSEQRLDYILYKSEQLKLNSAGFYFKDYIISDHYGLQADFSIK
jgi:endonuclease/exonuclease/phosphatase family metal-dependent hydrolase